MFFQTVALVLAVDILGKYHPALQGVKHPSAKIIESLCQWGESLLRGIRESVSKTNIEQQK